jgi:hypothetical protein
MPIKRTTELVYGQTGQVVENYPPEWLEGVPSTASAIVFRGTQDADDTAGAEFTPSVTVDAVSTTFDAASGQSESNRRIANLTATTGIAVGRHYLATNALSQSEILTPVAITSAASVTLDDDLKYDYASGATFKGLRMTFTVDATWVADESNILHPELPPYRVIWTYTLNSLVRRDYTYLRLVRQISKHSISIKQLQEQWPDVSWTEWIQRRGQGFAYLIDAAWERVRIDILTSGYKPDQFRDSEIIDQLVLLKSMHLLAKSGITPPGRDPDATVADTKKDYDDLFAKAILNLKALIDQGTAGAIAIKPLQNLWFTR